MVNEPCKNDLGIRFIINLLWYVLYTVVALIIIIVLILAFNIPHKRPEHIDERLMLAFFPIVAVVDNITGMIISSILFKKILLTVIAYLLFMINTITMVIVQITVFDSFKIAIEISGTIALIGGNMISLLLVFMIKKFGFICIK